MSEVLVREVVSVSGSNYVIQEENKYLDTEGNSADEKEWMSLDETIAVCCNIIQQIIKITGRLKSNSNL